MQTINFSEDIDLAMSEQFRSLMPDAEKSQAHGSYIPLARAPIEAIYNRSIKLKGANRKRKRGRKKRAGKKLKS